MQQTKRMLNYSHEIKKIILSRYSSSARGEPRKLVEGSKISVIRQITEQDVMTFAKLTDDLNPIHVDNECKIVHGALLNGFLSGVLGTKLPGPGTIVVHQDLRYPSSCHPGDKIEIIVEIISARKIITCGYKIIANSDRIVLEGKGKFVMAK